MRLGERIRLNEESDWESGIEVVILYSEIAFGWLSKGY